MIGSHNTFTYMRPIQWWARLLTWTARCQKKDIKQQLAEGIQLIDIRVRYSKKQGWMVCHWLTKYCRLIDVLLIAREANISVRLLIEGKYNNECLNYLKMIILSFLPTIQIYECRDKRTWAQLIPGVPSLAVEQYVGSMQSWYGKIFPILYKIFNRKKLCRQMEIAKESETKIALFDFI